MLGIGLFRQLATHISRDVGVQIAEGGNDRRADDEGEVGRDQKIGVDR